MNLLVTGGNGLVGSHFIENFKGLINNINVLSPNQDELDITNQASINKFFKLHKPGVIVHFAAFTNVSKAEEERHNKQAPCWIVNVEGTANLIKAASYQPYFIYISTDVVFSGRRENPGPYDEDFPTEEDPDLLSWYGWTKKEAEKLIVNYLENSAIVRIANPIRAEYKNKLDYVRKLLTLFDTDKLYPMFNDQYLTLTYINELTDSLKILLAKRLSGIFHVSSTNVFTPYKLAGLLLKKARGEGVFIKPISIENFLKDNQSRYPQYGGLKVGKTQKKLNLKFMRWEETISLLSKQLSV